MYRKLLVLLFVFLIFALPAWSQEGEGEALADPAEGETADGSEAASSEDETATGNTFRLYSRRDVSLRARPNVGLRLPALVPNFSPRTADFYERERVYDGPLFAVAASFDLLSVDGERDSGKGQEFRDLADGVAVGLDAQFRNDDGWFRLTGRHLGLDDQDARFELRRIGVFSANLDYNQIPHNYAFDARSIYSGIGTGRLEIDDSIQTFLQGSTDEVDAAERLREVVAGASLVDLGHRRDRTTFELDLTAFDPLAVELVVSRENRQGSRPWSGSFGLRNVVEIPWPVDYETNIFKLKAEYKWPAALFDVQYQLSDFDNDTSSVTFDNPWRIDDSSPANGVLQNFGGGSSSGLIDLYPSNRQHEFITTFVKNQLPGKSSFFATVALGRLEQDDPLVPFTVNTAVNPENRAPFDATDPANLPAASAQAELDTQLIHLRFTSKPTDFLRVKAHLRDYELDNNTAQIFVPGFVAEDAVWRNGPANGFTNLPITEAKTELGLELAFRLNPRTRLILDYVNEDIDREFREVEDSREDRYKISLDIKPAPWADIKASYLLAERDAVEYDALQYFTNQGIDFVTALPFLRKFDQADRDRDRAQVIFNLYPNEVFTVGGQVIVGKDDFPDSSFGVLDDQHELYAVDFSYALSERLSLFGSYSVEEYEVTIDGREWNFNVSDPFRDEPGFASASNWTARTQDEITSVVFGLDAALIPGKLNLDVSYTYSESDGRIAYASPIGEPGQPDNNRFDPADFDEVDDVTWYNLNPELEYTIDERFSLTFAYLRERYEILDFNGEGFEFVPTTIGGEFNGGLFMGSLPRDFDLDMLYLTLRIEF